ncbi:MAG: PQQ-binding-like beta-propeller repeat protein, partial [Bacteroidales bacterium]|nr:PQQ-binding-like beta-propeller repeat protein [Bacteroidales bacterium]
MKVKHPVFRSSGCSAAMPFLLSLLGFVTIFLLVSCDTGHYNFKPESMYWLQFRGPNASGIAPENADPPIRFNALTNLLWKTEMLPGWSSPCIVNDRIFLTGYNDSDSLLYTVAINRENGEILWRGSVLPHGYYDMHPINTYANASVASDGEKIFASFPNYGLIAYDLDGNMLWDFTHETLSHFYGGGCSPLIADSVVIIMINSNQDPRFMAIDCQTGDSVWTIRITEHKWVSLESSATPVLWNDLLILHLSEVIAAYNVIDGNV